MQSRATKRYRRVDRKRSFGEFGQDVIVYPMAQPCALRAVSPLEQPDAELYFHQHNGGNKDEGGIHLGKACNDVLVGLSITDLSKLGYDVGIEQIH